LHEFEDVDIYEKQSLDVRVIHVFLHNLENWYGSGDDQNKFIIQVQYGRIKKDGKFEVKQFTQEDDPEAIKSGPNLQYYWHLKYSGGYNMIKVKIMSADSHDRICHCYLDLHGHQRGKFIYFQRTMNAKEYTQNAESKFSLTLLKVSLFLESKKEKAAAKNND